MSRLAKILIYPVKSLDGMAVDSARVLPSGALENDRRFAIFDDRCALVNAKRTKSIQRVRSRFDSAERRITLWSRGAPRSFQIDDRININEWLSEFFGFSVELKENAVAGFPDDTESPGPTVISTATLAEVASWFAGLDIDDVRRRFRANIEIEGVEPFWEDRLYSDTARPVRFRVGPVTFEGTNPCQRCVVPTRSPETGDRYDDFGKIFEARRFETFPYWATRSRFDHFYRLAVNTRAVAGALETICAGDDVRVE